MAPAAELVRIVRAPDGRLLVGESGRGGRGAWLCPGSLECFEAAAHHGFARAFKAPTTSSALEALRAIMVGRGRMEIPARGARAGDHTVKRERT